MYTSTTIIVLSFLALLVHTAPLGRDGPAGQVDRVQGQNPHTRDRRAPNTQQRPSRRQTETDEDAVVYLHKFGWLEAGSRQEAVERFRADPAVLRTSMRRFQRQFGLEESGVLDNATMVLMNTPRCGLKDPVHGVRQKRFVLWPTKWPNNIATWSLNDLDADGDLTLTETHDTITQGVKLWTDNTGLQLTEQTTGTADIRNFFGFQAGVETPAPGGVLAYAYFPLVGDIYYDDEEIWSIDGTPGTIDYLWIVVHELGHALGLDHSTVEAAIMFPFYTGYQSDLQLHMDDILGGQAHYGLPATDPTTTTPAPTPTPDPDPTTTPEPQPTTTPEPTTTDDPTCPYTRVDAAFTWPGVNSFTFRDSEVRVHNEIFAGDDVFVTTLQDVFPEVTSVDAALLITGFRSRSSLYLIEADYVYEYRLRFRRGTITASYRARRSIETQSGQTVDVDAAIFYNGGAYLISGTLAYTASMRRRTWILENPVNVGSLVILQSLPSDFLDDIDAMALYSPTEWAVFNGDQYAIVDGSNVEYVSVPDDIYQCDGVSGIRGATSQTSQITVQAEIRRGRGGAVLS